MKIAILLNPAAGSSEQSESVHRLIEQHDDLLLIELDHPEACAQAVRRAVAEGCEIIAAAGGDGTVHSVLNAILNQEAPVALGVVPLGTGNDLARTLAIGPDPRDAIAHLAVSHTERFDVMRVRCKDRTLYGINAITGGFGGDVTEALSPELKAAFGPLSYIIGAVSALPNLGEYSITLALDGEGPVQTDAVAIVAANGRTIAGGKRIAPLANPQDGLLDVVIVKPGTLLDAADVGTRLVAGNLLASKHIIHRTTSHLTIQGEHAMLFNVDGEMVDGPDLDVEIIPAAIPVVVGPDYTAVVEP